MPAQPAAVRRFQRRQWASVLAPAHKSDLNALISQHACPKKWLYEQREQEAGRGQDDEGRVAWGRTALGSATHEALAWFLSASEVWRDKIMRGEGPRLDQVKRVYWEMFDRAVGSRELQWTQKDRPDALHEERVLMIYGALASLHERACAVEAVEAAFIVQLGDYYLSGHVDIVYRPRDAPEQLGLGDWKTGANKPDQLELDHGWEAGVYSAALQNGIFIPRERVRLEPASGGQWMAHCAGVQVLHASRYRAEREALETALIGIAQAARGWGLPLPQMSEHGAFKAHTRHFGQFPDRIHHIHLGDYVPYKRGGKKRVSRPEDVAHYGLQGPGEVAYEAGQLKGPAWLPVARTAHDVPRLLHRLRTGVQMVRLNVFPDNVGERCRRCHFARHCLTSGFAPSGDEHARLEEQLRAAGAGAQQELSIDD